MSVSTRARFNRLPSSQQDAENYCREKRPAATSLDCVDSFTARLIRSKIKKLIGRAGYAEADREDLVHEFLVDLLQRKPNFNPHLGTWEGFVVVVCENCFATLLERQRAEMRSVDREDGSLNRTISDADGRKIEIGSLIPESQIGFRTGQYRRSHADVTDMQLDVAYAIGELPKRLAEAAERLKHQSKTQAAREMGMSRRAFYQIVDRIAARFEHDHMRNHLED